MDGFNDGIIDGVTEGTAVGVDEGTVVDRMEGASVGSPVLYADDEIQNIEAINKSLKYKQT